MRIAPAMAMTVRWNHSAKMSTRLTTKMVVAIAPCMPARPTGRLEAAGAGERVLERRPRRVGVDREHDVPQHGVGLGLGDRVGVGLQIGAHHRGVDDPARLEIVTGRRDGLADLDGPLQHSLLLDGLAAHALDGAGHARAHPQLGVGGVGDRVHLEFGDVAGGDLELGLADGRFHGPPRYFGARGSRYSDYNPRTADAPHRRRPRRSPPAPRLRYDARLEG